MPTPKKPKAKARAAKAPTTPEPQKPGTAQPAPKTPKTRTAEYLAKTRSKPQVTNGGNPLQNAQVQEPLAESGERQRKPREPERICGAEGKRGAGPCRHPAGFRTDHKGSGRCYLHGGLTPAPTGRYSSIERPRVRELLERFESDPDPLNLLAEVQLLRALLLDFINRFDEQDRMLTRWNMSFEKSFQSDWADWWRTMRADALEREDDLSVDLVERMPDPMNYLPSKPLRMADITDVSRLIKEVGAMVDRIRKGQQESTFSMDVINRLWVLMGGHVTDAAMEVIENDDIRSALLTAVEGRWGTISLAELASRRAEAGAEAG